MTGELMSAAEARAKLDGNPNLSAQAQILDLKNQIAVALDAGRSSVSVSHMEHGVSTYLRSRGYGVDFHRPFTNDWRVSSYWLVSW